jgi:hypothetical protein
VIYRLGQLIAHGRVHFRRDARCQNAVVTFRQALENLHHLGRRFALSEDHLGVTAAQGPVVIEPGKIGHSFKGQRAQLLQGVFGAYLPAAYPVQQTAKTFFIHSINLNQTVSVGLYRKKGIR